MRAVEISQPGPPDVLKLVERPEPSPAAHEILIDVAAAGVNRPDVLQRLGKYPVPPGASDIPGLEVAGVVAAGETILIHGGTSGIGTTAIQLAHVFGARVFTTAGSDEKCAAAKQLGADEAFNYRTQDWVVA